MHSTCQKIYAHVVKADQLSALLKSTQSLKSDIASLWGEDAKITVSCENYFATAFESEDQKRIIGLAKLVEVQTGKGLLIGMIHDVVTDENFRGQGIGSLLIKLLIDCGETNKFHHLELTCNPSREAANRLYHRNGFILSAKAEVGGTNLYHYFYK